MNDRLGDGAHFLKSLAATPRLTGAVAPSGRGAGARHGGGGRPR